MQTRDLIAGYLALPPAPPAIGPDVFAGSDIAALRFGFYGEVHDLALPIAWDAPPGISHWGQDLNRFGFVVLDAPDQPPDLARRATIARLILAWIAAHPGPLPRWTRHAHANPITAAIRIGNWVRFLHQARDDLDHLFTGPERAAICASLRAQLVWALRRLRDRGLGDNWALIVLGEVLPLLAGAPAWPQRRLLLALARDWLVRAVDAQILPDGLQAELSVHYHWGVLDRILTLAEARDHHGAPVAGLAQAALLARLRPMAVALAGFLTPGGHVAAFGDSDAAEAVPIVRGIARVAALTGMPVAPRDGLWPDGGLVRLSAPGALLILDAGPVAPSHRHADTLSLWWAWGGEDLLIDPGRHVYDLRPDALYAHLRSSRAHSTIRLDDLDQTLPPPGQRSAPGTWGVDLQAGPGRGHRISGFHGAGYGPDGALAVRHLREVRVAPGLGRLVVIDRLEGAGQVRVEQRWQAAPGRMALGPGGARLVRGGVALRLQIDPRLDVRTVEEGATAPFGGWWAPQPGQAVPAPCLVAQAWAHLPVRLVTRLVARRLSPGSPDDPAPAGSAHPR